nr:YraN family protein [Rarobacter faecitabidus]
MELGRRGEDTVVALIEDWGWTLLDRNWSCRFGEIDIVAMDGHELAIIEVKTRSSLNFGHPAEAVDDRKLQRLGRLAAQWLSEHPDVRAGTVRIDVAAILQQGTYLDCEYLHGVTL